MKTLSSATKTSTKLRIQNIIAMFLLAIIMFAESSPLMAYAEYTSVNKVVEDCGPGGTYNDSDSWPSSLSSYFSSTKVKKSFDTPTDADKQGNIWYYNSDKDNKDKIFAAADSYVESQQKAEDNATEGEEAIAELGDYYNIKANTEQASGLLSGFTGVFSTFLGIVVSLVTIGMTIFTALDLAYIAFPVFRGKCDNMKAEGGMGTKQGKDGETKLLFITDDAQYAVVAADTVQTGKSPFIIYGKKRVVAFIVLAVLIFVLLTGNINILVNIGVKLASGILNVINDSL